MSPIQGGVATSADSRATARAVLDDRSGDVEVDLFVSPPLPPASVVERAEAAVSGDTFHGLLADLAGTTVAASPVVYGTDGAARAPDANERGFIVDFGGSRSVVGLELSGVGPTITAVRSWLGNDFAPTPAGPVLSGGARVGLSGVETQKLLVELRAGKGMPSVGELPGRLVITTGTHPTNVRASLNGRLPFFTKPGKLTGTEALTGLVDDLNALLSAADGPTPVTLSVTTDTPGVMTVTFDRDRARVSQTAEARWGGRPTTEVALASLETLAVAVPLPVPAVSLPRWRVSGLVLDVTGAVPPWRAYPGQAATAPGPLGLKVDARFSVARRFAPGAPAKLHGFALLLRPPADDATIRIELVADAAGLPGSAKPLAAAELVVPAVLAAAGAGAAWCEVLFPSPVPLAAGDAVWLSAKAKTGAVEWVGAAEPPGAAPTVYSDDASRWERYPSLPGGAATAQIRILRTPFPGELAPWLTVAWGDPPGGTAGADVGRNVSTLVLPEPEPAAAPRAVTPGGTTVVKLSVTAAATGTLVIERGVLAYRQVGG